MGNKIVTYAIYAIVIWYALKGLGINIRGFASGFSSGYNSGVAQPQGWGGNYRP